jgi:hypothetical protein
MHAYFYPMQNRAANEDWRAPRPSQTLHGVTDIVRRTDLSNTSLGREVPARFEPESWCAKVAHQLHAATAK